MNLVVLLLWILGLGALWSDRRTIRVAGWVLMGLGIAVLAFRTLAMLSRWLGG